MPMRQERSPDLLPTIIPAMSGENRTQGCEGDGPEARNPGTLKEAKETRTEKARGKYSAQPTADPCATLEQMQVFAGTSRAHSQFE